MAKGTLYLVPNTLDLGTTEPGSPLPDIQDILPLGVLQQAARLTHWAVENAKTTRAFLQRVNAVVPLQRPLQDIQIIELPRPAKGQRDAPSADLSALLAPLLSGAKSV